jgi:membrane protein YdbS with pleckstrin-like domain
MVGFDRFVWFVFAPIGIGGFAAFGIATSEMAVSTKVVWLLVVAIFTLVLYPMQVKYLVDRRRMWRP